MDVLRPGALDAESAGPGLVHELSHSVPRAQRRNHFVERLEVARDHAVVADSPPRRSPATGTSIVSLWTSSPTNMLRFPMTYLSAG
jgi:hypothetical protein